MKIDVDAKERSASFELPKPIYSQDGLEIAARVFSSRADVFLEETAKAFGVTLQAKSSKADPEALAGEFLNELLNQEYRFIVGKHNRKISNLIVTQALFAARGGENPPKAAEETPEFKAAVDELMKQTAAEIKRTMPKKLPPQGNPLPPAKEDLGV